MIYQIMNDPSSCVDTDITEEEYKKYLYILGNLSLYNEEHVALCNNEIEKRTFELTEKAKNIFLGNESKEYFIN